MDNSGPFKILCFRYPQLAHKNGVRFNNIIAVHIGDQNGFRQVTVRLELDQHLKHHEMGFLEGFKTSFNQ